MDKRYDLIIVGAGPAGITVSIYASRKGLDILVISIDIGGQTLWTSDIENYSGFQVVTGTELASKLEEHMKTYGIKVNEGEELITLKKEADAIVLGTSRGEYMTQAVIIASGKKSRKLNVPGEEEFRNKGVTYCATCDGPLFGGKRVAVIGGGNTAIEAAIELDKIASSVYVVNVAPELTADEVLQKRIQEANNTVILNNSTVEEVRGNKFVNAISVKSGKEEKKLDVDGVFVEVGLIPNSEFGSDLKKNSLGEIEVNCSNQTNIAGIFAAGDVTDVPEKQIIIAAGEGAKAAISAFKYLARI